MGACKVASQSTEINILNFKNFENRTVNGKSQQTVENSERDGTCLLRNLYAGQVRTGHGTTDWFQIGKGGCHPAYLTYMQNTS